MEIELQQITTLYQRKMRFIQSSGKISFVIVIFIK